SRTPEIWYGHEAEAHEQLVELYLALGRGDDAVQAVESALTRRRALTRREPHDPLLQRDLAGTLELAAEARELTGALDKAAEHRAEAARLFERYGEDP
ncbi:MAG: hypothetical protein KDB80_09050, partial [Planctomycetes bacterium]|nr:hypothetical protein [Planctomycetota bacterium]